MSMKVILSTQPASSAWGKSALISFNEEKATLHLTDFSDRTSVQKAARKLQNQGIFHVILSGEHWQLETCWAFYQGFYNA
ncbi:MAG: aminopeptidase PepB, partial [Aggregatibacter aphrophilus]|nr:aminopeptidase PepB [Aggregatibacter aphrophilus]